MKTHWFTIETGYSVLPCRLRSGGTSDVRLLFWTPFPNAQGRDLSGSSDRGTVLLMEIAFLALITALEIQTVWLSAPEWRGLPYPAWAGELGLLLLGIYCLLYTGSQSLRQRDMVQKLGPKPESAGGDAD